MSSIDCRIQILFMLLQCTLNALEYDLCGDFQQSDVNEVHNSCISWVNTLACIRQSVPLTESDTYHAHLHLSVIQPPHQMIQVTGQFGHIYVKINYIN